MMRALFWAALTVAVLFAFPQAFADDDPRTEIALPADVAAGFLAEMRTHMANLDDIVAALAEGDFRGAATIADINMTFGHHRWKTMAANGATEAEIAAVKDLIAKMQAGKGMPPGSGMRLGGMGMGPGFGRYMPEDFRAMGMTFHEAADGFAKKARSVPTPASAADYAAVLESLQELTGACRGCHDAFRVEGVR